MRALLRRPPAYHRHCHVVHHVTCVHQIEVEVYPASADVYYRDERFVDPINTQVRFEAAVYNGETSRVHWAVQDPAGNPGAGSIDATGLYVAPLTPTTGTPPHAQTDVIVATAVEDPLRKAFAFVTLIGRGPLPSPVPRLEIAPKQISLYYPEDYDNAYIDSSNTRQLFRAFLRDSPPQPVEWLLDGVVQATGPDPWYLYTVTGSGDVLMRTIKVRLQSDHAIADDAKVIQINYSWPGLL